MTRTDFIKDGDIIWNPTYFGSFDTEAYSVYFVPVPDGFQARYIVGGTNRGRPRRREYPVARDGKIYRDDEERSDEVWNKAIDAAEMLLATLILTEGRSP